MKKLASTLLFVLILSGCNIITTTNAKPNKAKLEISYLPVLQGMFYEAFLVNSIEYVSLGKFNIDKDQDIFSLEKTKISKNKFNLPGNYTIYDKFIITVENQFDRDPAPSESRILEGKFNPDDRMVALGFKMMDLSGIGGTFRLATPSDFQSDNEENGIWFYQVKDGKEVPGLKLPFAVQGWIYEAWIKKDYKYISLGEIGDVYNPDLNNKYSASNLLIKYPGEDFLQDPPKDIKYPINLNDGKTKVIITLEPWINPELSQNREFPFDFKILEKTIPKNLQPHVDIKLEKTAMIGATIEFVAK